MSNDVNTDELEYDFYKWKGKKTEPRHGYVILKSGKRIDGVLQLKGDNGSVEEILITYEGQERKLPTAAVKNYGLIILEPENDTEEDLYDWRTPVTSSRPRGTVITRKTKPMPGYVVTRKGEKVTGELQLKEENHFVYAYEIKNDAGKTDFDFAEVQNFGLTLKIADINKNGTKLKSEEALNFHPTSIIKSDGSKL